MLQYENGINWMKIQWDVIFSVHINFKNFLSDVLVNVEQLILGSTVPDLGVSQFW